MKARRLDCSEDLVNIFLLGRAIYKEYNGRFRLPESNRCATKQNFYRWEANGWIFFTTRLRDVNISIAAVVFHDQDVIYSDKS